MKRLQLIVIALSMIAASAMGQTLSVQPIAKDEGRNDKKDND